MSSAAQESVIGPLPQLVGQYRIEQLLSDSGSYADYAGSHASLGHPLLVRHERWPAQPGQELRLEALRRARRLQAELRHANIVPVVDFFQERGQWFSVFFRMKGVTTLGDLNEAIVARKRPRLLLREYLTICEGVASALATIHRAGFIHRTLNPHNVLVDSNGAGHVADLGCAIRLGVQDGAGQAARSFLTPWTAAPEQLDERESLTTEIDIWALGVLLYQLRYQRHPYATAPASAAAIFAGILMQELTFPAPAWGNAEGAIPSWSDENEGVEALIRPWLGQMLAKKPEHRFHDATEVERGLRVILGKVEGRPPRARAFVAMPFVAALTPLWQCIEAVCLEAEVLPIRVDQAVNHDNIWSEICAELDKADLMIAVVSPLPATEPNPNVMLEVGYMRALKRRVLLVTGDSAALPFDLRTDRAVTCNFTTGVDATFVDRLTAAIRALVRNIATPST